MSMIIRRILINIKPIKIIYNLSINYLNKSFVSDEKLIKKQYKFFLKDDLNLDNPIDFSEKLQWLKLNWNDPQATICADKYQVREYVEKKIGSKYLNELIGVYNSVKDIDIESLPKSFVLKGTHGSNFNLICYDKYNLNWRKQFKIMNTWLKTNFYWKTRETVYKDIQPRIICERLLIENESPSKPLTDFKFFCFNGNPRFCQVIRGRGTNETIDFYDLEWNHMPFNGLRNLPMSKEIFAKPNDYEKMIELAGILSEEFPFVRVDFYYVNNKIYFGELTFFPYGGLGSFYPSEWNTKIGNLLDLKKLDLKGRRKDE